MTLTEHGVPDAILEHRGKDYRVASGQTVRDSLRSVDLNPDLFLCVLAGELVAEDRIIVSGERYRLVAVVSGGLE
jgi:sulfur carrier protein ThiS